MKLKFPFDLSRLKKIKKNHLLLAVLAGILLLVIAMPVPDNKGTSATTAVKEDSSEESVKSDRNVYKQSLEKQLNDILGAIDGVGSVKVMITLKDTGESVVEKDITKSEERTKEEDAQGTKRENNVSSSQQETVLVQQDSSNATPFVTRELNPQVEGVLVVAEGAGSTAIVKNISDAVLALFSIEPHKIKVVKMNL